MFGRSKGFDGMFYAACKTAETAGFWHKLKLSGKRVKFVIISFAARLFKSNEKGFDFS
jgi:hypothetical protein